MTGGEFFWILLTIFNWCKNKLAKSMWCITIKCFYRTLWMLLSQNTYNFNIKSSPFFIKSVFLHFAVQLLCPHPSIVTYKCRNPIFTPISQVSISHICCISCHISSRQYLYTWAIPYMLPLDNTVYATYEKPFYVGITILPRGNTILPRQYHSA